jgi:hypothetical protein
MKNARILLALVKTAEWWVLGLSGVALAAGASIWALGIVGELGPVLVGFALGSVPPLFIAVVSRRERLIPLNEDAVKVPHEVLETSAVRDMRVGDVAFSVPWAVAVTADGRAYINGDYTTEQSPGGTVEMRIERQERGFVIEVPSSYKYQLADEVPWLGAHPEDVLPVIEVRTRE